MDARDQLAYGRRKFLGTSSAALVTAATLSKHAWGQGIPNRGADNGRSASSAGPENHLLGSVNPSNFSPPPTDHGDAPNFWSSFSTAHRRILEGGWSRQVNAEDFPIAREIAGVNMRLTAGGIRELHWNGAAEWGFVLSGNARLTAIDLDGKSYIKDLTANDLWYFPTGVPHSMQGLGPDGCAVLMVFDTGAFSDANTTQMSDWLRHTPRDVLAKNWGASQAALDAVYALPEGGRYIFQGASPNPIEQDQRTAAASKGRSSIAFHFSLGAMAPARKTASTEMKIVDARTFPVSTSIAAAHVVVKPGGLREMHWHPHADEWQYYLQGKARMTVFFNAGTARTADFAAGDIGYVPKTYGHYVENTGSTDLIFLELFRADRFQDVSLTDWIENSPPDLVRQNLGISREMPDATSKK
ncbi:MAG: oxdD [Bryobacterales bacterium]|nr:oxdD [Bryobacterales bacterium]